MALAQDPEILLLDEPTTFLDVTHQIEVLDLLLERNRERGTTVVDLSSPPALSVDLQTELGNRFISIDDLAWGPQVQLPDGLQGRLERLVSESGGEYCRWLRARHFPPAIQAMTEAAEARRLSELAWLAHRIPNLSDHDRAMIEQMSHRLVAGILHAPKSALRLDESGTLSRAAWELFGL